jgi:hypothetical protein
MPAATTASVRFRPSSPVDRIAAPKAHASGPAPYRVLLVGGRLLAESAARHQGLADGLATALGARTGHGIDVEPVVAGPMVRATARRVLEQRDLSKVDALVVLLEPGRERPASESPEQLATLVADWTERLTPGAAVVLVVPPPLAVGLSAEEVDAFASDVRAAADALTRVVVLDDGEKALAPAERFARWADAVAEPTAGALFEPMVRFVSDDAFDDDLRVDTVRALEGRYGVWTDAFQELVDLARSAYGTGSAAMSIIDEERTHYFARSGNVATTLPRGNTVCNRVMKLYGGLIVGDAALDTRLRMLPEVRTKDVTFYAGYRIEAPDGAPLGAICVFDPEPRDVDETDLTALRDLAIQAQRIVLDAERGRLSA